MGLRRSLDITAEAGNVSSEMKITVPRLGLKDVAVPTGSRQAELDKQGILHLRGSGLPWMAGSNTFITGHALGFPGPGCLTLSTSSTR